MKYFTVKIRSQTASFRDPDFQNFHKSLLLPPPTTIIGFFGAALGLSANAAQEYFEKEQFRFGVFGKPEGIAKDLWKYNNFKDGGVIHREILFKNTFYISVGSENEQVLSEIMTAVKKPVYALTMGNNDSLAFVESFSECENEQESNKISYCLTEGDIVTEVLNNADKNLEFSIYSTSDPIAHNLPVKFNYKGDYDVRNVIKRKTFSFVGEEMILNIKIKGITIDGNFIPTFDLN
jgi:CRISPR-associated protein Cas5t